MMTDLQIALELVKEFDAGALLVALVLHHIWTKRTITNAPRSARAQNGLREKVDLISDNIDRLFSKVNTIDKEQAVQKSQLSDIRNDIKEIKNVNTQSH